MLSETDMRAIINYFNRQNNDILFRFPQFRRENTAQTIKRKISLKTYIYKLTDKNI